VHRRSEKCITEGSKYAHWTRLYLSFYLNWVLGLFVHGRLQNLQTSEVTFTHVTTPLNDRTGCLAGDPTMPFFHTKMARKEFLQNCHSFGELSASPRTDCCLVA